MLRGGYTSGTGAYVRVRYKFLRRCKSYSSARFLYIPIIATEKVGVWRASGGVRTTAPESTNMARIVTVRRAITENAMRYVKIPGTSDSFDVELGFALANNGVCSSHRDQDCWGWLE